MCCFLLEYMDLLSSEDFVVMFVFSVSPFALVVRALVRMGLLPYAGFLIYLSGPGLSGGRGEMAMAVPRCSGGAEWVVACCRSDRILRAVFTDSLRS